MKSTQVLVCFCLGDSISGHTIPCLYNPVVNIAALEIPSFLFQYLISFLIISLFTGLPTSDKYVTLALQIQPVRVSQVYPDNGAVVKPYRGFLHSKQLCTVHLREPDMLQSLEEKKIFTY